MARFSLWDQEFALNECQACFPFLFHLQRDLWWKNLGLLDYSSLDHSNSLTSLTVIYTLEYEAKIKSYFHILTITPQVLGWNYRWTCGITRYNYSFVHAVEWMREHVDVAFPIQWAMLCWIIWTRLVTLDSPWQHQQAYLWLWRIYRDETSTVTCPVLHPSPWSTEVEYITPQLLELPIFIICMTVRKHNLPIFLTAECSVNGSHDQANERQCSACAFGF